MASLCRLCLCTIPPSPIILVSKDNISQEDKIKYLIPEIDLNLIPALNLCSLCVDLLDAACSFKQDCLKTEETIREYINQYSDTPVNLHEVKKFQKRHISMIQDDNNLANFHAGTSLNGDILSPEDDIKIEIHDVEMKKPLDITFICFKCTGSFEGEELFKKHHEECFYYKCDKCGEELMTKDGYNKHYKSHSTVKTCTICNRTFRRPYQLKAHNVRCHGKITYDKCDFVKKELVKDKFSCDAGFACLSHSDLREQLSEKTTLEASGKKSITCNKCDFVCSSQEELQKHNLSHKYCCHLCNKTFSRLANLQVHETRAHAGETSRKCSKCNLVLSNDYLLQRHMNKSHKDPIICEVCGLKCVSKMMLVEHTRTHTGERPFRCEICGKGFAQMGTLTTHIRCIHDNARPFKCKLCEKSFAARGSYRLHIEIHKSRERTFKCLYEGCGKKFMSERDRARHSVRHGNKRYGCKLCEKTFFDGSALKRHMLCHSGEKPFECDICHKGFTQASNLQVHLKSHRPKVEKVKADKVTEDKTDMEVHLPSSIVKS